MKKSKNQAKNMHEQTAVGKQAFNRLRKVEKNRQKAYEKKPNSFSLQKILLGIMLILILATMFLSFI